MKKLITLLAISFATMSIAQKQIFAADNLKEIVTKHKTVAILPFPTTISYRKQPKGFSAEANHQQELSTAKNIQSSMYTFLLRKRKNYSVEFQDVEKTNILLKKAGAENKLDELTKDEVCKILGVDAVISGKFESEQTKSDGAALTSVLLTGFGGKTGSGTLTMAVNDGSSGDMIWRFYKTMNDNYTRSTDDLVESLMRKLSRNFPYDK